MPRYTIAIRDGGLTNTATSETFDCFGETRERVIRIEADVVRRKASVKRSKLSALCLEGAHGRCDRYPEHTEGGHLIGLCLGGIDSRCNLVPMFAGFNQVLWKAIETRIYNDKTIVRMKVGLSYTGAEPRMPAQFWIYVQRSGSDNWTLYESPHMMEQPRAYSFTIPDSASELLAAAQWEMEARGWTVEDAGLSSKFLPEPAFRRYAVLDFLYWTDGKGFLALVADLGLPYEGFEMGPGRKFTPLQRELILRVNFVRNRGAVLSDLHRFLLVQGSSTRAAHIDHMVSMKVHSGYNAFSNAMVLSSMENTSKGAKRKGADDGSGKNRKRAHASS